MFVLIAAILSFLIASCSPVELAPLRDYDVSLTGIVVKGYDDGENTIYIAFKAINGIKRYGWGNGKNQIRTISADNRFFRPDEEGNIYYIAYCDRGTVLDAAEESSPHSIEFNLYGSPLSEGSEWLIIDKVSVELKLGDKTPDFRIGVRKETSVTLEARSEAKSGCMEYIAVFDDDDETQITLEPDSNGKYEIEDISDESFDIFIYHRYRDSEDEFCNPQTLTIPEYDSSAFEAEFSVDRSGKLEIDLSNSGLADSGLSYVGVFRKSDNLLIQEEEISQGISSIDLSSLSDGLFVGDLTVAAYNYSGGEMTEIRYANSEYEYNNLEYVVIEENIARQRANFSIPLSEYFIESDTDISVTGLTNSYTISDNSLFIEAKNLTSRTQYDDLRIKVGAKSRDIQFTTESFEGTYIWEATTTKSGYASQYAVEVKDGPDGSTWNYYIYVSQKDNDYSSSYGECRITPLYDESLGETFPGSVSYSSAPAGYKWNTEKWNSSSITPDKITSINVTENKKDSNTVVVKTYAVILTVTTTTSNTFYEEDDGTVYLVFYNEITDGTGDNYLRKNPNPDSSKHELDEHYYALVLQE